jgi:hypothetical protein
MGGINILEKRDVTKSSIEINRGIDILNKLSEFKFSPTFIKLTDFLVFNF